MSAFFAFLHHVAAFTLVASLAVEFALIKGELTIQNANRLLRADLVFGASAGVVLAVGLLRVFFFEKGASYYFHSAPFIAKLSLFIFIAILSSYPTLTLLSWRKSLRQGQPPAVEPRKLALIGRIIHWELAATVLLILCAALMARGFNL